MTPISGEVGTEATLFAKPPRARPGPDAIGFPKRHGMQII
jgi:hypothetical protein